MSSRFFRHFRWSDKKMSGIKINRFSVDYILLWYTKFSKTFFSSKQVKVILIVLNDIIIVLICNSVKVKTNSITYYTMTLKWPWLFIEKTFLENLAYCKKTDWKLINFCSKHFLVRLSQVSVKSRQQLYGTHCIYLYK